MGINLPESCAAQIVSHERKTSLALPYREEAKVQDRADAVKWLEAKIAAAEENHPIKALVPEDVKLRYSFNEEGMESVVDFDALEPQLVGEKSFVSVWVPENYLDQETDGMITTDSGYKKALRKKLLKETAGTDANVLLRKSVVFFDTSKYMVA